MGAGERIGVRRAECYDVAAAAGTVAQGLSRFVRPLSGFPLKIGTKLLKILRTCLLAL